MHRSLRHPSFELQYRPTVSNGCLNHSWYEVFFVFKSKYLFSVFYINGQIGKIDIFCEMIMI